MRVIPATLALTILLLSPAAAEEPKNGLLWQGGDLELQILMEYVSKVLDKRFVYNPSDIKGKKVAMLSDKRMEPEAMYELLQTILQMNNYILVEYKDFIRVEPAANAKTMQTGVFSPEEVKAFKGQDRMITQVFTLEHSEVASLSAMLTRLIQPQYEQIIPLPNSNMLVVTGFARNVERIAAVVEAADTPAPKVFSEYRELKYADAVDVAKQLVAIAKNIQAARPNAGLINKNLPPPSVAPVSKTNGLILTGLEDEVQDMKDLLDRIDQPGIKMVSEFIELNYAISTEVSQHLLPIVKSMTEERMKPGVKNGLGPVQLSADSRTNGLLITAAPDEITVFKNLITKLDVDLPELESVVRVYPVKNAEAEDLAKVLLQILKPNEAQGTSSSQTATAAAAAKQAAITGEVDLGAPTDLEIVAQGGVIVVRAPGITLDRIADLIKQLDIRRPKVLIEAAIVELTVTDDFNLGVELATVDKPTGRPRLFGATSVGLSSLVDTNNDGTIDARIPLPGNGIVAGVFKDSFGNIPLLLKALDAKVGVRVLAAPMIIADHNEEATFSAKDSFPVATFTTTQSTTDVTSFGNFQEAKIELKIKPNINEEEGYLRLEIDQLVESFQGDPVAPNLPPRKVSRQVKATLTVPNRKTVAVGGLSNNRVERSQTGVPILQHIPLLGAAFRAKGKKNVSTRLYVFVTTTILKDESFEDYRKLSEEKKDQMDEFMKEQEKSRGWKLWKKDERKKYDKGLEAPVKDYLDANRDKEKE
ncbi:MAG: hypothetical protein O3B01_15260 [Planctomycetota bacterium]|nr:hypothetical protein [Planctomycetota bacterium]